MKPSFVQEGKARVKVYKGKISKALPVFYNPEASLQRTVAIAFLRAIGKQAFKIGDALAGTGVRSIRFLKELPKKTLKEVLINDLNPKAVKAIKENLKLNRLSARVFSLEANEFMRSQAPFDYLEIDPFGSPNPFLDFAVRSLARKGYLAITATDTAPLAGTAPKACLRKYWSKPLRNWFMHENGIRILIRKVQLVASQYEIPLIPVYAHSTRHYYRVYFRRSSSKGKLDSLLKNHRWLGFCKKCFWWGPTGESLAFCALCCSKVETAGPLWGENLWDPELSEKLALEARETEAQKLAETIARESKLCVVGFYDVHAICNFIKRSVPPFKQLLSKIRERGFKAEQSHFSPVGIRTNTPAEEMLSIVKNLRT